MGPRRSVHCSIFSRRDHQSPPWSSYGNRLSMGRGFIEPRRFTQKWRMAHSCRPKRGPSRSIAAWPLQHVRHRNTLATYPTFGGFEQQLLYGDEPAQVGFGSQSEPHRLRLSAVYLRLTHFSKSPGNLPIISIRLLRRARRTAERRHPAISYKI
jgi:hypothetical protein